MTEVMSTAKKTKKPKAPKLFPDELIDQLLAQVQNKDAESIWASPGWQANSRSSWRNGCWQPN
jgi:putative transposase